MRLTISYEQFLQFCLASIEMDSLTGKLGVLPGKQQNDSFGLGENGWCDKHRILKYTCIVVEVRIMAAKIP